MKKIIFGINLFFGGLIGSIAIICSSLISNSTYAPVLFNNNVKLPKCFYYNSKYWFNNNL